MATIDKKIVYRVELKFISPINVSSGNEGTTDSDVMIDFDGKPFVPGTSIAGAFRTYAQTKDEQAMESLFGFSKSDEKRNENKDGRMSSIFISDLEFDNVPKRIIRDSVALDDNKISQDGAKFDFEALEGESTKGHFYMEVTIRDASKEELFKEIVDNIFSGIKSHEIRLGSKKTRGYGIIDIKNVKMKEFDKSNYLDYAKCYDASQWDNEKVYSSDVNKNSGNYIHIEVPLNLMGGISIRQYAIRKNSPDFVHITDHGKPVIPGTSFVGALRHRTKEILNSLSEDRDVRFDEAIDEMFGYVKGQQAHISNVVIDEAVIENAKPLISARTGVSRFESSAKNGALYQEKTYVGGNLTLRISVKKGNSNTKWIIGILLLAIKDLQNGFLAIGGQTSVGRGLFKGKSEAGKDNVIKIDGDTEIVDDYISKSFNLLKKFMENEYVNA